MMTKAFAKMPAQLGMPLEPILFVEFQFKTYDSIIHSNVKYPH